MKSKGIILPIIIFAVVILVVLIGGLIYFKKVNIPLTSKTTTQYVNHDKVLKEVKLTVYPTPPSSNWNGATPTIPPKLVCKKDEDCIVDKNDCKAVNKSYSVSSTGSNSCTGVPRCMYGACNLNPR